MVNKKQWSTLSVFLSYLLHPAYGFTGTASELPQCGLNCTLGTVALSACHTVANTTCLCNNDELQAAIQQSLQANCSVLEAIGMPPNSQKPLSN